MKRFISLLSLAVVLASNLAFSVNAASSYAGVDLSNAYTDATIYSSASSTTFEKTSDANDASGSSDVKIGQNTGEAIYVGFNEKFDGLSIDVGTSATGGKYMVEYYDGSTWDTLVSETTAAIQNDSSTGVFNVQWTRPSDWSKTTVNMSIAEDGSFNKLSSSLYFVRFKITSSYTSTAYADQLGVLAYNAQFDVENQLGTALSLSSSSVSFSSSSGDTTVYASKDMGSGIYGYALYAPSSTSYTYTLNVSGYVQESATVSLGETVTSIAESLNYTQVLVALDPDTDNEVTIASAKAGTADTTCVISNKRAYCPVPASQDGDTATVYADGYAPTSIALSDRSLDTSSQATNTLTLNYAYIATVKDEDGDYITNATVEMGEDGYDIDCEYIASGQYGCIVPTSEDARVRISQNDYDTMTTSFSTTRDDNTDSQVSQTFTLDDDSSNDDDDDTNDEIDLDVVSMEWQDDGDFVVVVENEGDEDVDDDENVYISVYVDGDREYYEYFENESGDDWLDAGEQETLNFGDDFLDDEDEEYTVEVCLDATDTVEEDDENNNCLEKTLEQGEDSEDGVDLEVEDIYMDDEDLIAVVSNTGDEEVDEDAQVKIYVYVDGDVVYTLIVDEDDDESDFFEDGDSAKINLGDEDDLFDDYGNSYDVEVCVDVGDAVDESDEDNNCIEEDEDELEDGPSGSYDCEDFVDVDGHWGEEYICNLFDRDVVEGYSQYYFGPDNDVSRAEFLKMALLDAGKDVYEVDDEDYSDVSSHAWYYEYVTYASYKGYVEGYADGSFRPDDDISRAEALVILFRIAGEDDMEDDRVDSDDINFWDVDRYDWFAWAVVLADDYDFVRGYNDGSFGPGNDLSRAEAAKIIDLAYEEFYQD